MAKKKTHSPTSKDITKLIAQASYDTKAESLTVLDLSKLETFADFFVVASGTSDRQVQAIADNIQTILKENNIRPIGVEGYQKGHWILLDYGSVVAHIFYEESRLFYGLEKLWGDAPRVRFRLK